MHFWINKGNQHGLYNWQRRCMFVRPPPEAVANYIARNQTASTRGFYPEPMVTPVRRFQSLESVTNNAQRYHRSPSHRSNRPGVHNNTHSNSQSVYYNGSTIRIPRTQRQEIVLSQTNAAVPENELTCYFRKFKQALVGFALFSVGAIFISNFLSTGNVLRLGVESVVVITAACLVVLVGGLMVLYFEKNTSRAYRACRRPQSNHSEQAQVQISTESIEEPPETRPNEPLTEQPSEVQELPPPPYHIAIRLSNQQEGVRIIDDQSPPPSYDKAIS